MRGGRAARDSPPDSAQRKRPQQHQQFELSTSVLSSRAKRLLVREQRSRCRQTEMTEEEMMDIALQLSEEEPRVSTLIMQQEEEQQQEEEAMKRSLHHSLAHASLQLGSRRKLSYPGRHMASAPAGSYPARSAPAGSAPAQFLPEAGYLDQTRKRSAGSPLLDPSHLSQALAGSPEGPSAPPDSPESCKSTQTEDADGCHSPVFPSSSCRAEVRVGRLDQDLLKTCTTLGFVRWSQDNLTPLQSPLSPALSGVGGQSPVFGRTFQLDETSQDSFSGPRFPGSPAPTPHPHRGRKKLVDGPPVRNAALESNLVQGLDMNNRLDNSLNGELDDQLGGGSGGHCSPSSCSATMETWNLAGTPLTCDTMLVVMNEDVTPPSPVFPQEHPPSIRFQAEGDPQNIHYYWGVPFCPGGLDPDVYTQVILAQFEVQKKCLKQAQRRLLNKAPWGGAVLPQLENRLSPVRHAESPQHPASSGQCVSRRLRVRRRKQSSEEEEDGDRKHEEEDRDGKHEEEEDDGDTKHEEEEEHRDRKLEEEEVDGDRKHLEKEDNGDGKHLEEEDRDRKHEEEEEDVGETRVETDCEFCPETQLSDSDSVQKLNRFTKDRDESPATSPGLQILRDDSAAGEEEQQHEEEQEEEEEQQQAQTEADKELRGDPDMEEVCCFPTVDCPLCQRPFPTDRIELHAAYCNGEVGPDPRLHVTLKPRRVKRRMVELSAEETSDTDRVQQEKCYICHRDISLSEYSQHTERCIQRHTSKSAMRGDLLLALQQNESRDSDAGPSHPKLQPGHIIDLRDDDKEEEEAFRISSSPIRTFTPISEATDCLVDFRRQRVKKSCHRRR